jgi:hypothetical protein
MMFVLSIRGAAARVAAMVVALSAVLVATAVPARAVVGGSAAVFGGFPFLARITMLDPGTEGARGCTGVLVAPRWVLTARECFAGADPAAGPAPRWPIRVAFAASSGTPAQTISVAGIKYDDEHGLALLALARSAAGVAPVPLSPVGASAGDPVLVVGYGRTAVDWVPDRPHAAAFRLDQVVDGSATMSGSGPQVNLCKGDAGSPALREAGGGLQLVAIATGSFQQGCLAADDDRSGAVAAIANDLDQIFAGEPFDQLTLTPADSGSAAVADAAFGTAVAMGDFNGDGMADVAVGAPRDHVNGQASGTVTVFAGTANGLGVGRRLVQSAFGSADEADDQFGTALAAGDFNRDGFADLAIGAPNEAIGTVRAGAVYIYHGSTGGLVPARGFDQADVGGRTNGAGDQWGSALGAGDFNRDGFVDVAVGAPGKAMAGQTARSGDVTVLKGSAGGLGFGWNVDQRDTAGTNEDGDRFGAAVAAGNVTGSAHDDLVVGAPGESPGTDPRSGALYVVPGAAGGKGTGFAATQEGNEGTNEAEDEFGVAVAVGNFDRDGYADVVVGIPGEAPGSNPKSGTLMVLPGGSSGLATGFVLEERDFAVAGAAGARFAAALAAGDTDGDGHADLLVGAPGRANGTIAGAGTVYAFRGQPRTATQTESLRPVGPIGQAGVYGVDEPSDAFGAALALGDLNRDGRADALIGSPGEAIPDEPAAGTAIAFFRVLAAAAAPPGTPTPAASDPETSIVETYDYPGAAQILDQHGLMVFRGDGHIVFVTSHTYDEDQCATGQLQVEKALTAEPYGVYYCFRTRGTQGFLTLEVPATFGIRGGDTPIRATAELPTGDQTFDVPPNGFVAVDPGTGSATPQAVLVELRIAGTA